MRETGRSVKRWHYTIRVAGRLDSSWSDWFEGLEVYDELDQPGSQPKVLAAPALGAGTCVTVLSGWMDQAALHGTLAKIRNLGLPLLSVTPHETEEPDQHPHSS
jgi:hypothetical protein